MDRFIRPYRIIPFDIGGSITHQEIDKMIENINCYHSEDAMKVQKIDAFQQSLSDRLIGGYIISDKILLFIYSFGIGVFSVQDEDFEIEDIESKYAIEYCKSRRYAHKNILEATARYSARLSRIMGYLREYYKTEHGNGRISALPEWENHGLSYVMTISYINSDSIHNSYDMMDDTGKHSLQMMLQPSLAHEEDSVIIKLLDEKKEMDPYDIPIDSMDTPKDFWRSTNADIYISWAAVVVIQKRIDIGYVGFINSMEVDLQAMWLYTYCLYQDLRDVLDKENFLTSKLKHLENDFKRRYNEFESKDDSSLPQYVGEIRDELINTSGINTEKERLLEYLTFCIDETEALEREHQRKYSWLNETLLYIIAYADIVTTLFTNFYDDIGLVGKMILVMVSIIILPLGIVFIVKKG